MNAYFMRNRTVIPRQTGQKMQAAHGIIVAPLVIFLGVPMAEMCTCCGVHLALPLGSLIDPGMLLLPQHRRIHRQIELRLRTNGIERLVLELQPAGVAQPEEALA